MSLVAPTSSLTGIANAAAEAGILRGHDLDDTVYVEAHQAPWRIFCIDIAGWLARRTDGHRRDIPEATGWLGVTDLEPEKVVANLLQLPELATDFFGHQTWLRTAHPWQDVVQPWYARCPDPAGPTRITGGGCGLTGPIAHDNPNPDLDHPLIVRCRLCRHDFDGRPQAVPATSHVTCPCCDTDIAAPVEAMHYCCPACGWRFFDHTLPTRWYTHLLRRNRTIAVGDDADQ